MDALKNEILRRALAQYTQASNPAAFGSLALPQQPQPQPPAALAAVGRTGTTAAERERPRPEPERGRPAPNLSVNAPDVPGSGSALAGAGAGASSGAGAAPNGVRALQEPPCELREEGARIEEIQLGAQKRRHAAGAAEGRFDSEAEGVPALAANAVATNEKRKRPRAAQDAL